MERPERPSRHKLNRVKVAYQRFSSDSESEVNDNDVPIHITYYQSAASESGDSGGPSTSASGQLISHSADPDTPSSNMTLVGSVNTITLTGAEAEESQAEPQDSVRRKRPATSSVTSVLFDPIPSCTSAQEQESLQRPTNPSQTQHSGFIIRPRSFCHIDNANTIRPPVFKCKRLNGPIDLTPGSSSRVTLTGAEAEESQAESHDSVRRKRPATSPVTSVLYDPIPSCTSDAASQASGTRSLWGNILPSTSTGGQNWSTTRTTNVPFIFPPRSETARSTILRHFDDMVCSTSPIARRRIKPSFTYRNSSLDDYCDLVGNFLFNCPVNETNNQRSRETAGMSEPQTQTSTTADIINRHVSTTPDLISHESSTIINEISVLFDQPPIRNTIESVVEPTDQGSDDVIVVESPNVNASPETFMVPSSRSPSPSATATPPSPTSSPHKQDKAQANQTKEVPMTLQELNQSLVSLLECPVCLDHATPPIFQCCKGHILCQSCHPRLTTCPICRSRLPGNRNSVMEKVAEKLMYPCKNTVTGCSQMLKLDDKQKHEEGCGFRHYTCIITSCHWKGYKPELVVHLQSTHPDKLISGAVKELHVPVPATVPDGSSMLITHHWIQSAHNEVFSVVFHVDLYKRIMKGCVIYIGSPEKAEKFSYVFELKQRVAPFRKLSYSRTTHADTLRPYNDFSINIDVARLYRDYILHAIPVHISIIQNE